MPRFLKKVCLVLLLALSAPQSDAFSLAGPFEDWQTPALGYDTFGDDITAPKNLGEEYRWTQPIITYGFDRSFLDYFGLDGVEAIDEAFEILNALPPASQMLEALPKYPLDSRRLNYRAMTLNLLDVKSTALGLMMNQLGLDAPERYTWALRARMTFSDPDYTNYLVIQRNFDPVTFEPTYFVNGTRYSYRVLEFENPTFADALEFNIADPAQFPVTSVAGALGNLTDASLSSGIFFRDLTRDDVGGLRYLYRSNNINVELPPGGTQVFVPNRTNLVLVTNMDLTLFSMRSLTSSIVQITNFYPGLQITAATPTVTNIGVEPVVTTQPVFLNEFTNYSVLQILTNIDLNTFSSLTLTTPPAALLQQFPNLSIRTTNMTASPQRQIASITLTNGPRDPWGSPFQTNLILVTNYVTNLVVNYHYEFWNVLTNYSSPVTLVERQISGIDKEPWSSPLNPVYKTNFITYFETVPSGGIIILPPGIVGYEFVPGLSATNIVASTNILFLTNFVQDGVIRNIADIENRYFTNVQYAAYPIQALPNGILTNILVTNFVTTPIISYDFEFGNVLTNYSFPTTPVVTNTYTVSTNPLAPGIIFTNLVSVTPGQLPVPSGGFLIDTNLTGFEFATFPPPVTQVIQVTNVVFDFTNPLTGERTIREVVYNFTNTIYAVYPFFLADPTPMLRPGVEKISFVKLEADSILGNTWLYTNRYRALVLTNGLFLTNTFQRIVTQPDILFAAADLGTVDDNVAPVAIARSINMTNMAEFNYAQPQSVEMPGPGIIGPRATITFNKIGPSIINRFPNFNTEETALFRPFVWGKFDASTNAPIVFPEDITLDHLEFRELNNF